jgi:Phospholipase_D-nuclease N-terminal
MVILRQLLPFLIPILLLQLALIVVALIDLARRERTRGPKWAWVLIIVLINFIGPIVYFVVGREE